MNKNKKELRVKFCFKNILIISKKREVQLLYKL